MDPLIVPSIRKGRVSMRTEIGSEFCSIQISEKKNNIFLRDTVWFLSGRIALKKIIKVIKSKYSVYTVAIPSWCCESMIIPFLEADLKVEFYSVTGIEQNLSNINTDIVLVMDYFGYTGHSNVFGYNGIVIRDITHSLFSEINNDADYYFGSLRKWDGFLTGGFAWNIDNGDELVDKKYIELRRTAMSEKLKYINGLSDSKEYLKIYGQAEKYLELLNEIKGADLYDIQSAQKLDVNFIKKRRRENAKCLLKEFVNMTIFKELKANDCPMFVPILVPDGKRDALRRYLIAHEIYCPVHWPVSEYHQLDDETKNVYVNGLSLVCDQRYTEKDMKRMINVIKQFWEE